MSTCIKNSRNLCGLSRDELLLIADALDILSPVGADDDYTERLWLMKEKLAIDCRKLEEELAG